MRVVDAVPGYYALYFLCYDNSTEDLLIGFLYMTPYAVLLRENNPTQGLGALPFRVFR